MRSDDDVKRDKWIARSVASLFICAFVGVLAVADSLILHTGFAGSIWPLVLLLALGMVSHFVINRAVDRYWQSRGMR